MEKIKMIKPTYWEDLKTEGIDFCSSFVWLDDYPFQAEIGVLANFGAMDSLYKVNLFNDDELLKILEFLKRVKASKLN